MRRSMTVVLGVSASAILLTPAIVHGAASSNLSLAALGLAGVTLGHLFGRPLRTGG